MTTILAVFQIIIFLQSVKALHSTFKTNQLMKMPTYSHLICKIKSQDSMGNHLTFNFDDNQLVN